MFPPRKPLHYRLLPRLRKEVNERQHHVVLKWKASVWRLHPESPPHASYFLRKRLLVRAQTDVLDHGVTEHNVEGVVPERQQPSVSSN